MPSDWEGRPVALLDTEERRIYLRQARRYPSVTTAIGAVFPHLFANVGAATLQHAQDRGKEVHKALALLYGAKVNHTLNWDTLDPEVAPRVKLIHEWLKKQRWNPLYVERAFYSDVYGFGGTPDQVGRFGPEPPMVVLDFKPRDPKTADIQLAGYGIAVQESLGLPSAPARLSLNVGDSVQPVEYTRHARDAADFLHVLGAYNYGVRRSFWK